MSSPHSLRDIFGCPRGQGPLMLSDSHLLCPPCAARFDVIDGVPIRMPDGQVQAVVYERDLMV